MNCIDFQLMKQQGQKITMVTCYDFWSAQIIENSNIDCVLVGDSVAMVVHGHETTIPATVDLMCLHITAVARGIKKKFIIGDLPFLSYRKNLVKTMCAVEKIMHAGAHAIKLEGADGNEKLISHIVKSGVPVMGHLGLTPQAIHQLGGFRVQGKQADAAEKIIQQARSLEAAGCFAIVLECVPAELAKIITKQLTIPTIGIGAGMHVDGQVLVFHDLIGISNSFKPKFLKTYCNGFDLIQQALNQYSNEVKQNLYPTIEHCYT